MPTHGVERGENADPALSRPVRDAREREKRSPTYNHPRTATQGKVAVEDHLLPVAQVSAVAIHVKPQGTGEEARPRRGRHVTLGREISAEAPGEARSPPFTVSSRRSSTYTSFSASTQGTRQSAFVVAVSRNHVRNTSVSLSLEVRSICTILATRGSCPWNNRTAVYVSTAPPTTS